MYYLKILQGIPKLLGKLQEKLVNNSNGRSQAVLVGVDEGSFPHVLIETSGK